MAVMTIGNKTYTIPEISKVKVPAHFGPGGKTDFRPEAWTFSAGGVNFGSEAKAQAAIQAVRNKLQAEYDREVRGTAVKVAREKAEAEAAEQQAAEQQAAEQQSTTTTTTTGGGTTVATDTPTSTAPSGPLSIEDRNRAIIDMMTGQAAPPELIDPFGRPKTVRPFGGTYTPDNITVKPEELMAAQAIPGITPTAVQQAGAAPTITEITGTAPTVETAQRQTIQDAQVAQLTREEIAPEVSISQADVTGTVSAPSIAVAPTDTLDTKATVQGQLENLYGSIVDGQPLPPWASGAVRIASQVMQQRGLGASSIAAAALVQAVQESAIPIAAADAQAYATLQLKNLDNRQKAAISNSLVYAQMDQLNQSGRVKAAINNAQSFLAIDTANLTNEQSVEQINFQANVNEMFSDQAVENATRQLNAKTQVEVDKFYTQFGTGVRVRNAELAEANSQFNVDQTNAIQQFNQKVIDSRDKFNATLGNQIAQSNAVWRRSINTANNVTQNEANKLNAQAVLGMNEISQANLWQAYRDDAQFLVQTTENALQRAHQVGILSQQQNFQSEQYKTAARDSAFGQIGQFATNIINSDAVQKGIGKLFE